MFAGDTSHVVASLILLDAFLAAGAWFGVGHDPLHVGTLSGVLVLPLHRDLAVSRLVALVATQEAKRPAAVATDFCDRGVNAFLVAQLASLGGAPLDALVVVCVGFAQPFPIHFELFGRQQALKDAVTHFQVAVDLHALSV